MIVASFVPLLALGIFVAEMCVVTLGTLRIIFIARGWRYLAPILGFFEVVTWLFAISQVMQNLNSLECFLAFALGFTAGNFLGMNIERKLAMGKVTVRIITHRDPSGLMEELRAGNFGYTCVQGEGAMGPVRIVMTVIRRRQLDEVIRLVEIHQPKAFYAVDELQTASEGIFPAVASSQNAGLPAVLQWLDPARAFKASPRSAEVLADLMVPAAAEEQIQDAGQRHQQAGQAA